MSNQPSACQNRAHGHEPPDATRRIEAVIFNPLLLATAPLDKSAQAILLFAIRNSQTFLLCEPCTEMLRRNTIIIGDRDIEDYQLWYLDQLLDYRAWIRQLLRQFCPRWVGRPRAMEKLQYIEDELTRRYEAGKK